MKRLQSHQLAKAVGPELSKEFLISAFVKILKDTEAEVRTAAGGQVPGKLSTFIHASVC